MTDGTSRIRFKPIPAWETSEAVTALCNAFNDAVNTREMFITAKRVEGCSEKTLKYYSITIKNMLNTVNKSVHHITTDDLRTYLVEYQKLRNCSKANIDNIRRNLSSFFSWLEDENYIIKSPIRRIHKIKATKPVKETYTDESLELMRDSCEGLGHTKIDTTMQYAMVSQSNVKMSHRKYIS